MIDEPPLERDKLNRELQNIVQRKGFELVFSESHVLELIFNKRQPYFDWSIEEKIILVWIVCKISRKKPNYEEFVTISIL